MEKIIAIFKDDVRGLVKNILALVIALGVCFLPSLYAWFNIYSNWDPYANTGNVPIAVCSDDAGYVKSDGTEVNMGDKVIDQLHENDKLGWQFPETSQEAIDGVYSGEYYAALIIEEDFSESMYDCLANGMEHPKIQYYENEKRNAIAIKITDSGSSSLQSSINTEFLDVVVTTLSEHMNELASDNEGSLISSVETKIRNVNDNLIAYENLLDEFMQCNNDLSNSLIDMKALLPKIQSLINGSVGSINQAKGQAGTVVDAVGNIANGVASTAAANSTTALGIKLNSMAVAATSTNQAINSLQKSIASGDKSAVSENIRTISGGVKAISDAATDLSKTIEETGAANSNPAIQKTLKELQTSAEVASAAAAKMNKAAEISDETHKVVKGVNDVAMKTISPQVDILVTQLPAINQLIYAGLAPQISALSQQKANETSKLVNSAKQATKPTASVDIDQDGLEKLLDSCSNSLLAGNVALESSQEILHTTTDKISSILSEIEGVTEEEKYQKFIEVMKNEPALYGEFFSQPVSVVTEPVYETTTYGAAVTPFYTTLALWVGAIILVAIIKVHATPKNGYKTAKHYELFFGRYLIFFILGQIQALICVWGDLHLLKVQCHDKGLFYLAGCLASFTFTLLIYTLTVSFGDIGKAFAVVIMVIQIAGSSGTYPIELLPDIFQAIYKYFPFPYAINAIREIISGRYQNDYWVFLGELLLFALGALVVGLVIRIPFMHFNHFIEERMEDTKMM